MIIDLIAKISGEEWRSLPTRRLAATAREGCRSMLEAAVGAP
jgi:hypothetical protein